jgi:hypothetical protein
VKKETKAIQVPKDYKAKKVTKETMVKTVPTAPMEKMAKPLKSPSATMAIG